MKQNQLNNRVSPYKGRARPNTIGAIIVVGFIIAIALVSLPQSFADEPGKEKQLKLKATVIAPKDDQPAVEINPVKAPPTQVQPAPTATATGEQIKWQVISSGGTKGGSASYQLAGTVGQISAGTSSSESYGVGSGFWHSFEACAGRGDANGDGVINSADVVYLINYLFKGGPSPEPLCTGDMNCDGIINSADVVYLINYLFKGGPPPSC
jgi:hypothetical protein